MRQKTNLDKLITFLTTTFSDSFIGPWKVKSIALLSILFGFYIGSNLTVYYLQKTGQRTVVVFLMVLLLEVIIRLRNTVKTSKMPLKWVAIDNIRMGSIYAVILEAFKLRS